jgi:hypothetical protein
MPNDDEELEMAIYSKFSRPKYPTSNECDLEYEQELWEKPLDELDFSDFSYIFDQGSGYSGYYIPSALHYIAASRLESDQVAFLVILFMDNREFLKPQLHELVCQGFVKAFLQSLEIYRGTIYYINPKIDPEPRYTVESDRDYILNYLLEYDSRWHGRRLENIIFDQWWPPSNKPAWSGHVLNCLIESGVQRISRSREYLPKWPRLQAAYRRTTELAAHWECARPILLDSCPPPYLLKIQKLLTGNA